MALTLIKGSRSAYKGPDPVLVKLQLQGLQNILRVWGMPTFCAQMLWILRKPPGPGEEDFVPEGMWNNRLVPFQLNKPQVDIVTNWEARNVYLKYRQGGYTTLLLITRLYVPAITEPGAGCLLVSQNNDYAARHFMILRRAHKFIGAINPYDKRVNLLNQQLHENLLHTQASTRKELIFDQLDSIVSVASAEVEEVGQGLTLTHVHCSEVARWEGKPEETLSNLKEAIAGGGTLDLESTANGLGGYFYEEVQRARDPQIPQSLKEFKYFFHEWWWDKYRATPALKRSELDEKEKEMMDKVGLDLEQMTWRRAKMISLRHNFPEKYPEDPVTCFLVSGNSFFDRDTLRYRLTELYNYKPVAKYRNGELQIFQSRIKGRRYIIGADPITGRAVTGTQTDFAAACVLDFETGEEVAALRLRAAPEDFAIDLDDLGRMYNMALMAIERNGEGAACIVHLQIQLGYPNIYEHKDWHKKDRRAIQFLGFPTTPKTRPIALNTLGKMVREHPELIWDTQFIMEAITFVRNEEGKPEAAEGAHDDTVLARAIAHYVRLVEMGYFDPMSMRSQKYGEDTDSDEPDGEAV